MDTYIDLRELAKPIQFLNGFCDNNKTVSRLLVTVIPLWFYFPSMDGPFFVEDQAALRKALKHIYNVDGNGPCVATRSGPNSSFDEGALQMALDANKHRFADHLLPSQVKLDEYSTKHDLDPALVILAVIVQVNKAIIQTTPLENIALPWLKE